MSPIEPSVPNPETPKPGYNVRAPRESAVLMLIDEVNGVITTFEVVNLVSRFIPKKREDVKRQIIAARLAGALVLERTKTNAHWLAAHADYSDRQGE